jgi:peptidoglycan/LPS O-acetylase OafA/YrhL
LSPTNSLAKGSRIPYLDGLRAYSILLVVLGHTLRTNSWHQPKGYLQPFLTNEVLGPRIFFVLSGFLITTLLLDEEETTGHISIRGFL